MKHTGIYVDLGYRELTQIAVIKNDRLMTVVSLVPQTEFEDVIATVVTIMKKYEIMPYNLKSHGFPELENKIKSIFRKENLK